MKLIKCVSAIYLKDKKDIIKLMDSDGDNNTLEDILEELHEEFFGFYLDSNFNEFVIKFELTDFENKELKKLIDFKFNDIIISRPFIDTIVAKRSENLDISSIIADYFIENINYNIQKFKYINKYIPVGRLDISLYSQ